MKKYFYHVSYYMKGEKEDHVGDCIIVAPEPIKAAEGINAMREAIAGDKEATVVILNFQLLRIENDKAEEVEA